jgi:O-antigen/teichoic acid export membrane protein
MNDQAKKSGSQRLVKDTLVYGVATVVSQMTSFILLPVYTRALTPHDYGYLELLQLVVDFTGLFVTMRLGEAIFRFYSGASHPEEANRSVSTSLILALGMGLLGFAGLSAASQPLAKYLFQDSQAVGLLVLTGTTLLMQPLVEIPAAFVRAQQRSGVFLAFRLGSLALRVGLSLILVAKLRLGVTGAVYANVAATAVQAVVMSLYTVHSVGIAFDRKVARQVLGFTLPILVAAVGSYYLGFADRYFLKAFGTLRDVGIYALAARFAVAYFALGFSPFEQAWDAARYHVAKEFDAVKTFQQIFRILSVTLIALGLAISVFCHKVIDIMTASDFWAAAQIVPILLLSYLVQIWTSYCRFGLLFTNRTKQIAVATLVAMPIMTLAFYLLVPSLGAVGAAIGAVIGFSVRLVWTEWKSSRSYNMHLQWGLALSLLLIAVGVYCGVRLLPFDEWGKAGAGAIGLMAFSLTACLGPWLTAGDRQLVTTWLKRLATRGRPNVRASVSG